MTQSGSLSETWTKRAIDARTEGEQALALFKASGDEGAHASLLAGALRESLDVVSGFLRIEEARAELQNPTWRPLYRQADVIYFVNDRGENAPLPAIVAVAFARGRSLAWKTRVRNGVVEIELEDGTKASAPMTLIKALSPRRWPEREPTGAPA